MVLVDYSHLVHRMLYVAIADTKPRKQAGKFITEDFKNVFVFLLMQQLIYVKRTYGHKYGEIVICLDNSSSGYWRKDICPLYKAQRGKSRDESDINFSEVFDIVNEILDNMRLNFPFKILDIEKTEADDTIMVLSKTFSKEEKILIYSEDKDFFQQLKHDNVDFFRPVAKKWITREEKDLDKWTVEHVCLGDESDNVPRIVDNIWFSDNFKKHLSNFGLVDISDKMQLDIALLDKPDLRENIFNSFSIYKKNRKGENTDELDIYNNPKMGESTLWKAIEKAGGIEQYINSHPYMKKRYELNKLLVLEEYIPEHIEEKILQAFNIPAPEYNIQEIENLFKAYNLKKLMPEINILVNGSTAKEQTTETFNWDW